MAATIQNKETAGLMFPSGFFDWIPSEDRKLLLIITLVGFFLRIWDLGGPSFWYDEVLTLHRSEMLFEDSKALLFKPPGYYFLGWLSIQLFGASEVSIRLPSAIFGTLTIPLIYVFTMRIQRDDTIRNQPILAAAFLTIFPLHIAASRDAKEYAFLAFLVLLVMLLIVEAIHSESLKLVLLGAAAQSMAFLTSFLALAIFPPVCFFLLLKWPREEKTATLQMKPIYATGLFTLLPVSVYGLWLQIPREGFDDSTSEVGFSNWLGFGQAYWYLLLLLLYIGGGSVLVFMTWLDWRDKKPAQIFAFASYALFFLILSAYRRKAQRYFVIAVPLTVIFLAEGIQWIYSHLFAERQGPRWKNTRTLTKWAIITSVLVMPTLFLIGFFAGGAQMGYHPNWRGACDYVKTNSNSEVDSFWSTQGTARIAAHYLGEDYQIGDLTELESNLSSLQGTSQGRIWIIVTKNRFENKISPELQDWIRTEASLVWDTRAEDLTTQLLADIASDTLSLLGVKTLKWWSLDRMRVYSLFSQEAEEQPVCSTVT